MAVVDDAASLRALAAAENFPVALRVLPAALRRDLTAVYDVARTIDDLGDDPGRRPAERLAALTAFEADLQRVWADRTPQAPVLQALLPAVAAHGLAAQPFLDLVAANRLDQTVARYADWADLRGYCRLSADPVGRIVLAVFDAATPANEAGSDDVCTALQVLEHCQDVAEDLRDCDRVYLPQADLDRFGVSEDDLRVAVSSTATGRLVRFEVARARELLAAGPPLVRRLTGWGRFAVAGYVAGGLATADALDRPGADVLAGAVRPRRRDVVRHLARLLAGVR